MREVSLWQAQGEKLQKPIGVYCDTPYEPKKAVAAAVTPLTSINTETLKEEAAVKGYEKEKDSKKIANCKAKSWSTIPTARRSLQR